MLCFSPAEGGGEAGGYPAGLAAVTPGTEVGEAGGFLAGQNIYEYENVETCGLFRRFAKTRGCLY